MAENTVQKEARMTATLTVAECSEFHSMGEEHTGVKTVKEAMEIFGSIPPERMNGIPAIGVRVANEEAPELFSEIDIFNGKRFDMEALSYVPEIRDNWDAQRLIPFPFLLFLFLEKKRKRKAEKKEPKKRIK